MTHIECCLAHVLCMAAWRALLCRAHRRSPRRRSGAAQAEADDRQQATRQALASAPAQCVVFRGWKHGPGGDTRDVKAANDEGSKPSPCKKPSTSSGGGRVRHTDQRVLLRHWQSPAESVEEVADGKAREAFNCRKVYPAASPRPPTSHCKDFKSTDRTAIRPRALCNRRPRSWPRC